MTLEMEICKEARGCEDLYVPPSQNDRVTVQTGEVVLFCVSFPMVDSQRLVYNSGRTTRRSRVVMYLYMGESEGRCRSKWNPTSTQGGI
jgi:hypothetical protein